MKLQPGMRVPKATRGQLASLVAPYTAQLVVICLVLVSGAVFELVPPLIMQKVIDAHLTVRVTAGLPLLAGIYLGVIAGIQMLGFAGSYLTARTAQAALRDLRVRLFDHFQKLPLSYYDRTPLGDILSRCTADVDTIDTLFTSSVSALVTDLIRLVTLGSAMILLSPELSLVATLTLPGLVLITNVFRRRIRDAERSNRLAISLMNTQLQETLVGLGVIKVYDRAAAFVRRFRLSLRKALDAANNTSRFAALYAPIMEILMGAVVSLLLWSGVHAWFEGWHVTLGTLTAFILLFRRFFDPITELGEEWQAVQSALAGAERIFEILDLPGEKLPETALPIQGTGSIEVDHLVFGYYPDRPVVRDISFKVNPGEHVALVGRTGAGKSSILHLLGGLYEPWQGSVRVAGVDPRAIPEEDRRRVVGIVPQVVQLFSGTVRENLTLGDDSVPIEAIRLAAHISGAEDFIEDLPEEYSTSIGSLTGRGVQLSAGQRQLLSLARTLVWSPPVLLFDEATSAIDSASEVRFRQALLEQSGKRAILTVAHRLSTAREAHRVLVMENGRIVEEGTPAELIRKKGRFAALLELEEAGWDWQSGLGLEMPGNGSGQDWNPTE
jgi:ATP-binding cassette subfamily B multidrug efflux pump